ncbi:MAG: hypothetical protein GTN70_04355 [Deltaproteobacteria bacterium]|nr:hypothetical protein [Deltaproteobacteria bacterium]
MTKNVRKWELTLQMDPSDVRAACFFSVKMVKIPGVGSWSEVSIFSAKR